MTAVVALARRPANWAPVVAAALAALAVVAGIHGVDLPAAVYRVDLFRRVGLTLWDSQWYSGHWTLDYSVIFPPAAGTLGITLTEVISAGGAAWMFERLVTARYGAQARVGALLFACGTLAQVAIGQLPFLLGESLALAALWSLTRGHRAAAVVLALSAALASPLAGGFLGLAAVAFIIDGRRPGRLASAALGLAALIPVLALSFLFQGAGPMPFPTLDFVVLLVVFTAGALAIPARHRSLRLAGALYLAAIVASYVVPTAVGGNISRLGECVGAPLLTCVLWPGSRRRLALIALPMVLLQAGPALGTVLRSAGDPSVNAGYFQPAVAFLRAHASPEGRVEAVPTALHWEAAYMAASIPLARGWERQLDTADNPLFYDGTLSPSTYRAWLLDNGVRYVALPDVPLDYAANAEGRLLRAGVPGLPEVWRNAHWRIYAVGGSSGLVTGPARLTRIGGATIGLDVLRPGTLLLRIRYSAYWTPDPQQACLTRTAGGWISIRARQAGALSLRLEFDARAESACPPAAGAGTGPQASRP
jgi:hypothetical protein